MRCEQQISYNRLEAVEVLPESPELERAVLGALILEPEYLPDTAEMIEISAFQTPIHGKIYGMMLSMLAEGVKIDLYTLTQRCKTVDGLGNPAAYLAKLTQAVGSGVNVLDHARQLKDTETRRRLCLFGHELAVRAASDPSGVLDWATTEITAIAAATVHADDITPLSEVVRATLDELELRQQARQEGECIGISTGLQRLDALTGGWRGGQLVVLAGRPGKSATMLHFARTAAVAGVPICLFSTEMPNTQLAGRMLVGGSGVNSGSFRTGDIDADGWRELERAAAELSALPVYINDRANITMGDIRSQCKAMARRGRCGMVIIDYLQLLDTASRNTNSTREREIAAASRSAKLLAKELDIPVILLSQLSRKIEERTDKTPMLSDLRESGAIEQDADIVAFIDRPAMYGRTEIDAGRYGTIPAEGVGLLHIAKNREGATGCVIFRHNESITRIADYESTANPPTDGEPF